MPFIRGNNPIWFEVDLTAHAFDDTFYLFILQNEIPYLPATTWQDPFANVAWTNPIRFLANGTLPNNIYYDQDTVYRLEFRQGPTQADPLIYLVENYVPGTGGAIPPSGVSFSTDNQITNPQFSLINFHSPLSLSSVSSQVINIAPGWDLNLTGSGDVTLTQILLNDSVTDPTNASYALQIQLSGSWTNAYLSQRFNGNGILWSNTFVSSSITALSGNAPQNISAILIDSEGTTLTSVLSAVPLSAQFNEYRGVGEIGSSSNTDFPPTAYIEYQLLLPNTCNVTLTSFQLVSSDVEIQYPYEQNTIERQVDHTFHYYKPLLSFKPIPSLLAGWDFPLNPRQFGTISPVTTTPQYVMDQTIMASATGNVALTQSAITGGITLVNASALEALYALQYLSGAQAKKILGSSWSVNIQSWCNKNDITVRVYLYRGSSAATFPSVGAGNTIGTIANTGIFTLAAANWSLINRGTFGQALGTVANVTSNFDINKANVDLGFSGWEITDNTQIADTDKFAIVVTYQIPTITSTINLQSISLVPGGIPTRPAPQSMSEVLYDCGYYYQKSFIPGVAPASGVGVGNGENVLPQINVAGTAGSIGAVVNFSPPMVFVPNVITYNVSSSGDELRDLTTSSDWTSTTVQSVSQRGFYVTGQTPGGSAVGNVTGVNWTANSIIGA